MKDCFTVEGYALLWDMSDNMKDKMEKQYCFFP